MFHVWTYIYVVFVIICSCPLEVLLSWLFLCMWQFEQTPIATSIVIIVFVIIFFGNNIYVKAWLHPWENLLLFIHIYAPRKSNPSWINHSFSKKSSLDILWVCVHNAILNKWTSPTNLMEHIQSFGVLSTSAPSNPNSSSSLFKQPSPSCTHWHYVIKHNLDTLVKMLVFIF
jgi:hypothetical protein